MLFSPKEQGGVLIEVAILFTIIIIIYLMVEANKLKK